MKFNFKEGQVLTWAVKPLMMKAMMTSGSDNKVKRQTFAGE